MPNVIAQGHNIIAINSTPTIVDAASYPGNTTEAKIAAAVVDAKRKGASVYLQNALIPYDETQAGLDSAVQMYSEGSSSMPGVYDARAYGGKVNASRAIKKCISLLPVTGGTVDCRSFVGAQNIDVDMFSGLTQEIPITIIFGPATFTQQAAGEQRPRGKLTVIGNNTTFFLYDGSVGYVMWDFSFVPNNNLGAASVTNGSATITVTTTPAGVTLEEGRAISIFGHLAQHGGRDNTTLNGAIDNVATSLQVLSTGFMLANHYLKIDNELMRISSVTDGTHVVVVRGQQGTTAASHVDTSAVDRVVYQSYEILSVNGNVVTLDEAFMGVTSDQPSGRSIAVGPSDVSFLGTGTMNGNKPAVNSPNNPGCIFYKYGTRLKIEKGWTFRDVDHTGVNLTQCRKCVIDGYYQGIGWPDQSLGFSVVFFQGNKYCTAYGDYEACATGPTSDDRSTVPGQDDNAGIGNILAPRVCRNVQRGPGLEGNINSEIHAPIVDNWGTFGGPNSWGIMLANGVQWVTNPTLADNFGYLGFANPAANAVTIASTSGDSSVIYRRPSGTISFNTTPNGVFIGGKTVKVRNGGAVNAIDIDGPIAISGGPGITLGAGGTAKINFDGNDGTFAASEMGICENVGNMNVSVRGTWQQFNANTGSVIFSVSNVGVTNAGAVGGSGLYKVGGTQVVAARKTGWSTWTGTANRATKDTSTATLADVAQTLKALLDDLHSTAGHGLIGT